MAMFKPWSKVLYKNLFRVLFAFVISVVFQPFITYLNINVKLWVGLTFSPIILLSLVIPTLCIEYKILNKKYKESQKEITV